MLDDAGFDDVAIVLSSNLDELSIWQILSQIDGEASRYGVDPAALGRRLVYGVGTRLITSHGHAALDGVYKLVAVADESDAWRPAINVSDTQEKIPIQGQKRVLSLYDDRGSATADVVDLPDEDVVVGLPLRLHHIHRSAVARTVVPAVVEELVHPVDPARDDPVSQTPGRASAQLEVARDHRRRDLDRLDPGVRRLVNPHIYHASLTDGMKKLRDDLVAAPEGVTPQ
jgi:nicotinate phosphoribosyltransferase